MTKELQINILNLHHEHCVEFWERSRVSGLGAQALALLDILNTRRNPFSPKGECLDADVRREFVNKLTTEFSDAVKQELERLLTQLK